MERPPAVSMRFCAAFSLFPLYRPGRLRCQVEEHTVDPLDLAGDSLGDMLEQREGHILHGSGHGVHRIDRPDNDAPLIGPAVVPDAY